VDFAVGVMYLERSGAARTGRYYSREIDVPVIFRDPELCRCAKRTKQLTADGNACCESQISLLLPSSLVVDDGDLGGDGVVRLSSCSWCFWPTEAETTTT
jgi:hypothetical protein